MGQASAPLEVPSACGCAYACSFSVTRLQLAAKITSARTRSSTCRLVHSTGTALNSCPRTPVRKEAAFECACRELTEH